MFHYICKAYFVCESVGGHVGCFNPLAIVYIAMKMNASLLWGIQPEVKLLHYKVILRFNLLEELLYRLL